MTFVSQWKTIKTVKKYFPSWCVVKKCEGGFLVFDNLSEYVVWKNQK